MHTIVLYAKMETSCLVIQDVLTVRVGALTLSSVSELAKKRSESPCFYTVGYSSITMPFAGTMLCLSYDMLEFIAKSLHHLEFGCPFLVWILLGKKWSIMIELAWPNLYYLSGLLVFVRVELVYQLFDHRKKSRTGCLECWNIRSTGEGQYLWTHWRGTCSMHRESRPSSTLKWTQKTSF